MPVPESYYAKLIDILPANKIPDSLRAFEDGLENVLSNLYYSDLDSSKSQSGDAGYYSLSIISFGKAGLAIPGTDFLLILNPDISGLSNTSVFPVTLNYHWPIVRYIQDFRAASFTGSPQEYFEIF